MFEMTEKRTRIKQDIERASSFILSVFPELTPDDLIVAGGCVRDYIFDLAYKDVDIFVDHRKLPDLFNNERRIRAATNGNVTDLSGIKGGIEGDNPYNGSMNAMEDVELGERYLHQVFEWGSNAGQPKTNLMITGFPESLPFTPFNVIWSFDHSLSMAYWNDGNPLVHQVFNDSLREGHVKLFSTDIKTDERVGRLVKKLSRIKSFGYRDFRKVDNKEWSNETASLVPAEHLPMRTGSKKTDGDIALDVDKTSLQAEKYMLMSGEARLAQSQNIQL